MAIDNETLGAAIAICGTGGGGGSPVSAYTFKGSVATPNDLPSLGNEVGDVYDVRDTGANYAWTGTAWDALGQIVNVGAIEDEIAGKVDKVTGKGLSTEDYTATEKTKLAGIEAGAQVNTVTGVKGSGESTYKTGNVSLSKASIGLSEVDNTSDANKPVSLAQQAALDEKADQTTIAEEFSTQKAYKSGDYVYYNGKLYRFTSGHTAGVWNPSHVVETIVLDEIGGDTLPHVTSADNDKILRVSNGEWTVSEIPTKSIEDTTVTLTSTTFVYDGTTKTQTVASVVDDGVALVENTDYTIINNTGIDAGTHTLTVLGLNKYSGAKTVNWTINKATLTRPTITSSGYVYDGTSQAPVLDANYDEDTMSKSGDVNGVNAGSYTLSISLDDTNNYKWDNDTITDLSLSWSIGKANGSVTLSESEITIDTIGDTGTVTVTTTGDGLLSVSSADDTIATAAISGNTVTVTTVTLDEVQITVTMADGDNYYGDSASFAVNKPAPSGGIYGAVWDKTSTTALTRTDDATLFTDPVPAVSGGAGSSPFDNIMPWSGMVKETINGNVMVKIPKFWYKWTDDANGLKIQIANYAEDGFHVSPAHADRRDGKGERDFVYIGRYHCDDNYKSTSGVPPKTNITRNTARTGCKTVGDGYSQLDYAMWWTVGMLYLVEFANWDSQTVIGYGCGNGSSRHNSGASDTAQYHTGTMKAERTTYGAGVQYRFIEDLWGNVLDWCDGIVLSSKNAYVTNVVADYSDSITNHTQVGTGPSSGGCISDWNVPSVSGLEWALYPKTKVSSSNYDTYCADYVSAGYVVVYVGGNYYHSRDKGMFYSSSYAATSSYGYVGSRLQFLP